MIPAIHLTDFYKTDHRRQYPKGIEMVYSNITARGSRVPGVNHVVVFGVQYLVKRYLKYEFDNGFFECKKDWAVRTYKRRLDNALGKDAVSMGHIAALHDLGYLPIHIKALAEGTRCPMRVPFLTICNTLPEFAWVTNFLETLLCNVLWHPMTSATLAYEYRNLLNTYAIETGDLTFVPFQGHDFSMRGHTSIESACISGGAHLTSFVGTDTIPSIDWLEQYYNANSDKELIGCSVPATEHSVMCMNGKIDEYEMYHRLLTEVYPKGIVSVVSDTYDYWGILTNTLPRLKDTIVKRDGKLVIRPDSGDPVKIICGDPLSYHEHIRKGTVQLLWDTFGGAVNSKGYKVLDPHIGVIYGDSITLERCQAICQGLKVQGFASTNMVYGIGSYTYQYVSRDTFGFAMKATAARVDGKLIEIFKDPATDNGLKRSAKGLLRVNDDLTLSQQVTEQEECHGLLETVFRNGLITREESLSTIRQRLQGGSK